MLRDSWSFWPLSLHRNSAFSQTLPSGCHHHLYLLGKKTLSFLRKERKVLGKTSLFVLSWNFNPISLLTPVLPWFSALSRWPDVQYWGSNPRREAGAEWTGGDRWRGGGSLMATILAADAKGGWGLSWGIRQTKGACNLTFSCYLVSGV